MCQADRLHCSPVAAPRLSCLPRTLCWHLPPSIRTPARPFSGPPDSVLVPSLLHLHPCPALLGSPGPRAGALPPPSAPLPGPSRAPGPCAGTLPPPSAPLPGRSPQIPSPYPWVPHLFLSASQLPCHAPEQFLVQGHSCGNICRTSDFHLPLSVLLIRTWADASEGNSRVLPRIRSDS